MSSWMIVTGIAAGFVAGAASMWLAVQALAKTHADLETVHEESLGSQDLTDSGGSAYTTKDDGPIHRDESWWRSRGAR